MVAGRPPPSRGRGARTPRPIKEESGIPKIIAQALLLSCLAALPDSAWGQPAGPPQPGSFSPRTMEEARRLYARPQSNLSSAQNMRERLTRLDQVLAELFSAGHQRLGH